MLKGKKVVLGITGGIAAYKSPLIIRLLQQKGASVRVAVTTNALEFTTISTLETLSNAPVYHDMFAQNQRQNTEHIALADWANIVVIAPATANIIGKMANGIADDALSTFLLAFRKQIFLAPAMNEGMWLHFSVQRNIEYLKANNVKVIEPVGGELACGWKGMGRMEEPENIVNILEASLKKKSLKEKKS